MYDLNVIEQYMKNIKITSLPFLRTILKMAGWTEEEIDQIEKEAIDDPDKYIEVLKALEDEPNNTLEELRKRSDIT